MHTYQVSSYGLDSQAFDLDFKLSSLMVLFSSILLLPPGYPILLTKVASYRIAGNLEGKYLRGFQFSIIKFGKKFMVYRLVPSQLNHKIKSCG